MNEARPFRREKIYFCVIEIDAFKFGYTVKLFQNAK